MTAIESRCFSGGYGPVDAEWIAFLSEIFRDIPLDGLIRAGLRSEDARRLINLMAMAIRFEAEDGQSDETGEHFFSNY